MATIQLLSPTFLSSPAPSPAKTPFKFHSGAMIRSSSSRSGSFNIKCSNNGSNATATRDTGSGLKDLMSGWVDELPNKDGRTSFVDSLRKAAQRVVQPERETNMMKQEISQLITRDKERVKQHETEIKKMKQDLNCYKTRSEEKLEQQETEIKEMKQQLSRHRIRAVEIDECEKRLSEALTLVAEAKLSLQDIIKVLRGGNIEDCSGSVYI